MELQSIESIDEVIESLLSNIETEVQQVRQLLTLRRKKKTRTRKDQENRKAFANATKWFETTFKTRKDVSK